MTAKKAVSVDRVERLSGRVEGEILRVVISDHTQRVGFSLTRDQVGELAALCGELLTTPHKPPRRLKLFKPDPN